MFAPLKDVLGLYQKEKVPSLAINSDGEFEVIVRDPDGSVASHIKQHNAATEVLRWQWYKANEQQINSNVPLNARIAIWENSAPLNAWAFSGRYFMPGTFSVPASYTYTPSTHTWLIQGVFGAGTTRTLQTVMWCYNTLSTVFFGTGRAFGQCQAYTVLSQPVIQLSTQTLEINYRITFTR